MGNPEWTTWDICSTMVSRRENIATLDALIMAWMMDYTKVELFEMGQREGVSCFPVNTVADVYTTEQYKARGFFEEVEHPQAGTYAIPGRSLQDNRPSARAAPTRAAAGSAQHRGVRRDVEAKPSRPGQAAPGRGNLVELG